MYKCLLDFDQEEGGGGLILCYTAGFLFDILIDALICYTTRVTGYSLVFWWYLLVYFPVIMYIHYIMLLFFVGKMVARINSKPTIGNCDHLITTVVLN